MKNVLVALLWIGVGLITFGPAVLCFVRHKRKITDLAGPRWRVQGGYQPEPALPGDAPLMPPTGGTSGVRPVGRHPALDAPYGYSDGGEVMVRKASATGKTEQLIDVAAIFGRWNHPRMIGGVFVYVDCRGCMAEDHQIRWVGVGDHFEAQRTESRYTDIVIRVVKRNGAGGDSRDEEFPKDFERACVEDGAVQEVAPGLWFIFK